MPESINWSFTSGGTSGSAIQSRGATQSDGLISVSVTLKDATPRVLSLQVKDVSKVSFLAISSDLLDGSVSVKADASKATKLVGPILLFGDMVKLFAGDLSELTVVNSAKTKVANLTVQIGLTV